MALTISLIASNQGNYTDEEFSRYWTNHCSEGIFNTNSGDDFAVTESTPNAMTVDIDTGQVLVTYTKSGSTWKVLAKNSVSVTKTINANSSGSNRVDAVIVHLTQDEPNSLKNNVAEIQVIDGSGVAALTDGAIDTAAGDQNWYRLADITVPDSASTITNSDIADTREFITLAKFKQIFANIITESNTGEGVTVDDWLFKDDSAYVTERGSSPSTPSSGDWAFFFKSDGLYIIDDVGLATKLQSGGIATSQKAEASAAAGEIFENTDNSNNLGWKDSGSTVHDIIDQALLDTQINVKAGHNTFAPASTASTKVIAHGLGRVPSMVTITWGGTGAQTQYNMLSEGTSYYDGTQYSVGRRATAAGSARWSNTTVMEVSDNNSSTYSWQGVITVDATNITISVPNFNDICTISFVWKAE